MSLKSLFIMGGIGLLAAGCLTSNKGLVLDGVGPNPDSTVHGTGTTGMLLVYSAYEANADFNSRDARRPEYSDYEILTTDGKLQQRVHNSTDTILQRPRQIELPAGKYRVVAEANSYGFVTVPVTIVAGRDTLLHLEGGFKLSEGSNAVRLPNGETVGWKDTPAPQ